MTDGLIKKNQATKAGSNMPDYSAARRRFSWDEARTKLAGHRISDGHRGALFLAAVGKHLQTPEEL